MAGTCMCGALRWIASHYELATSLPLHLQAHFQEAPFNLRLPVVFWRLWQCTGVARWQAGRPTCECRLVEWLRTKRHVDKCHVLMLQVMGVNELKERVGHKKTTEDRLDDLEESMDSAVAGVASGSIALLAIAMK